MKIESIGFVGGGRVTRFLLEGWQRAAKMPRNVRVSDLNKDVAGALKADFPSIETCVNTEAARADLVVLAVHPPVMKDVLTEIRGAVNESAAVLSLAPKVTAAAIGLRPEAADQAILKMVGGAAELLLASGRPAAKVMDMVPVKPLKDDEASITAVYRAKLSSLYEKIRAQ